MPRFALVLALACCSAACVPNKIYRPSGNPADPDPSKRYFVEESLTTQQIEPWQPDQTPWPYRLAFIEFDDRGEMFKRAQLERAVTEIARARADAKTGAAAAPTLALFVHGWKNNASDGSGNVWGFRQVLAGLSKQNGRNGPPVIGIYIGWRGAVVSAPGLKEFTFFDRQRKSQNLPASHLVEALTKVLQAAKGPEFNDADAAGTLLIGHSFGGAVLETALEQTLLGIAVRAKTANVPPRWPADLIVLVNEAQEATRSFQLIDALHANGFQRDRPNARDTMTRTAGCLPPPDKTQSDEEQNRPPQKPIIVSISSTGDTATRLAFVGGQSLQRPFNSLRSYTDEDPNFLGFTRQTPMFLNTTAHRKEFQSHLMGKCSCVGPVGPNGSCEDPQDLRCEDPAVDAARQACRVNIQATLNKVIYAVVEKPAAKNRTPYWVMQMPPSVVPDHSTIFSPLFRDFLYMLLRRTLAPDPPVQP